eukprot:Hpha_TRINITY_DN24099_c0_g1::TRINITY_DN24099_c0_g1_i1::g.130394::m.130394
MELVTTAVDRWRGFSWKKRFLFGAAVMCGYIGGYAVWNYLTTRAQGLAGYKFLNYISAGNYEAAIDMLAKDLRSKSNIETIKQQVSHAAFHTNQYLVWNVRQITKLQGVSSTILTTMVIMPDGTPLARHMFALQLVMQYEDNRWLVAGWRVDPCGKVDTRFPFNLQTANVPANNPPPPAATPPPA